MNSIKTGIPWVMDGEDINETNLNKTLQKIITNIDEFNNDIIFRTQAFEIQQYELSEQLREGNLTYKDSDNVYKKALFNNTISDNVIGMYRVNNGKHYIITSGLVEDYSNIYSPGKVYYLSEVSPGLSVSVQGITDTPRVLVAIQKHLVVISIDTLVSMKTILKAIETMDGAGSGLDGDMLDGKHQDFFGRSDQFFKLKDSSFLLESLKTVDGIGSGIDADTLDGLHAENMMMRDEYASLYNRIRTLIGLADSNIIDFDAALAAVLGINICPDIDILVTQNNATDITITSSTGSSDKIGLVTDTVSGLLSPIQAENFNGIARFATINDPVFTGLFSSPSTTTIGGLSSDEIDYLGDVDSNLQDQIDGKAPVDSPGFLGAPMSSKPLVGAGIDQIATTSFIYDALDECLNSLPAIVPIIGQSLPPDVQTGGTGAIFMYGKINPASLFDDPASRYKVVFNSQAVVVTYNQSIGLPRVGAGACGIENESVGIFAFGTIKDGNMNDVSTNSTDIVSDGGDIIQTTSVTAQPRHKVAATGIGGDKGIFGFGSYVNGVTPDTRPSHISIATYIGGLATLEDTTVLTENSEGSSALTYGDDKYAMFTFGVGITANSTNNVFKYNELGNAISTESYASPRFGHSGASYDYNKGIFCYGIENGVSFPTTIIKVSETGALTVDSTQVTGQRAFGGGSSFGQGQAMFVYGLQNTSWAYSSLLTIVSNTGIFEQNTMIADASGVGVEPSAYGQGCAI